MRIYPYLHYIFITITFVLCIKALFFYLSFFLMLAFSIFFSFSLRILVLGHALLVGVGGSGKQSLVKLAAFVCQFETVQLSMSSEYGINELKEDLKVSGMEDD